MNKPDIESNVNKLSQQPSQRERLIRPPGSFWERLIGHVIAM